MHTNLFTMTKEYLTTYFVTLEQLASQSGITKEQILTWVSHECMPAASYELTNGTMLRSFVCTEVWLHSQNIELFFPKGFIHFTKELAALFQQKSLFSLALYQKENFHRQLEEVFRKRPLAKEAFPSLFDVQGQLGSKEFQEFTENLYDAWLKGTYGLWVKDSHSPQQIAQSEIVQNYLKLFTQQEIRKAYSLAEKEQIQQALTFYEGFSMPLGPHDHPTSNRRRLIENIRKILIVSS